MRRLIRWLARRELARIIAERDEALARVARLDQACQDLAAQAEAADPEGLTIGMTG